MKKLAEQLIARAETDPEAVAVIDAEGEHTLGELVDHARRLADALAAAVDGAPTVLVQADNSWRTLTAAVAVGLRGGLLAVFSRHAESVEFGLALDDVRPDAVLADPATLERWACEPAPFPLEATTLDGWVLRSSGMPPADISRWAGGSVVAMTSGSTGRPKSVVQSEDALRYASQCTIDAVGLRPGDPVAAFVPLSSVAAICFGMYLPAMLGAPMVCLDGWKPDAAVAVMHEQQVRWTMLVPTMALQLSLSPGADGRLSSLAALTVGGGPMDAGALERAETVLGTRFLRVFGMSECLGHTTPRPDEPATVRLGRDGRPFPGTTVRAVTESGDVLPPGQVGLAQVKGPSLFVGYARDGAPVPRDLTEDGFLPTGDLVEVAEDGTIRVTGRQKQIIIRGGRNIDVNEVEAAVASMPAVAQVCVVPVPDPLLGERAAALVVGSEEITLGDVTDHLAAAGFPRFKWPELVFSVPALPQNRVGKLSRPEAISLAERLSLHDPSSRQLG